MRILIITDSYPPEVRSASHLMQDLARALVKWGAEVWVLTSFPRYNLVSPVSAISRRVIEDGVNVVRVKTPPHHRVNFIVRGFSQLSLPFVFARAFQDIPKPDAVYVHIPPLPLAVAARMAKRKFGAKFLLNVHDIFPQHAVDLGILKTFVPFSGSILKWFFERMERKAYTSADAIFVPSPAHADFLHASRDVPSEKITVLPHWVSREEFGLPDMEAKRRFGLEGKFVFFFGGVLGPAQNLEFVLSIAEQLKNSPEIAFLFAGDGTEKERLMQIAQKKNLQNVKFIPFVSKEEFPSLAAAMDVGLVCLSPKNTTPIFPAKISGYMASRLPVLAFVNKASIGAGYVKESGCGVVMESTDVFAAAETAKKMAEEKNLKEMGERGYQYLSSYLTAEKSAEKVLGVIK